MSQSSPEVEAEREVVMDKLRCYEEELRNPRSRYKERDMTTLRWLLHRNITKLITLPIPEFTFVINTQLDLCNQLLSIITKDQEDCLERHCARLRRRLVDLSAATE
jgi:hypothetical protein